MVATPGGNAGHPHDQVPQLRGVKDKPRATSHDSASEPETQKNKSHDSGETLGEIHKVRATIISVGMMY